MNIYYRMIIKLNLAILLNLTENKDKFIEMISSYNKNVDKSENIFKRKNIYRKHFHKKIKKINKGI